MSQQAPDYTAQQQQRANMHAPAPSLAMSASQAQSLQQQAQQQGGGDLSDKLRQLKIEEQQKQQQQQQQAGSSSSAAAAAAPAAAGDAGAGPAKKKEMGAVRYAAERVIGNGSFGVVYQATVIETGETVAIKKVLQVRATLDHATRTEQQHCRPGFECHPQACNSYDEAPRTRESAVLIFCRVCLRCARRRVDCARLSRSHLATPAVLCSALCTMTGSEIQGESPRTASYGQALKRCIVHGRGADRAKPVESALGVLTTHACL